MICSCETFIEKRFDLWKKTAMQCPSQMDTFEFPQFKCLLFEGKAKGNLKMVKKFFLFTKVGK